MTYSHYLYSLLTGIFLLLCIVAVTNYSIDPANIYHSEADKKTNIANNYTAKLLNSKHGLFWQNNTWNMRDVKKLLARQAKSQDCAVIGSSHVLQISSFRDNKVFAGMCSELVNLGVPGGTLEDFMALTWEVINDKQEMPKRIIYGINLWSLDVFRDLRWERYKESHQFMQVALKNDRGSDTDKILLLWGKYINLINPDYFYRSLTYMKKIVPEMTEAPLVVYDKGINSPVLLPDGSLVYSKEEIEASKTREIPVGGIPYKVKNSGTQYSIEAIEQFTKMVNYLQAKKIEVIFLMTPYHINVWSGRNSLTAKSLIDVESRIKLLAQELGVRVLGSYDPQILGCDKNEFFDQMHPKVSCLLRINK